MRSRGSGAESAAPKVQFGSAQPKDDGKPAVAPWATRIVETVFLREDEIDQASERLRRELSLGASRSDYGSVMEALDRAEENTRLAFQLSVTLKAERDQFENSAKVVESAMRDKAKAELEEDQIVAKEKAGKAKTITEADIALKIASIYQDGWEELMRDRRRLELAVRYYDNQVEVWASRCRSLQMLASKLR